MNMTWSNINTEVYILKLSRLYKSIWQERADGWILTEKLNLFAKELGITQYLFWKQTSFKQIENEVSKSRKTDRSIRQVWVFSPDQFSVYSEPILGKPYQVLYRWGSFLTIRIYHSVDDRYEKKTTASPRQVSKGNREKGMKHQL